MHHDSHRPFNVILICPDIRQRQQQQQQLWLPYVKHELGTTVEIIQNFRPKIHILRENKKKFNINIYANDLIKVHICQSLQHK